MDYRGQGIPPPPPPPNRFGGVPGGGDYQSSAGYDQGGTYGSPPRQDVRGYAAGAAAGGYGQPYMGGGSPAGAAYGSPHGSPHAGNRAPLGSAAYSQVPMQPQNFDVGHVGPAAPNAMQKEFFVNVVLNEWNRSENAANAAKAQGRAHLGRAGSIFGGIFGAASQAASSVVGKSIVPDGVVTKEVQQAVCETVENLMLQQGWVVFVQPMNLPPLPGQDRWSEYVVLGHQGHYMVFRGQLLQRSPQGPVDRDGQPSNSWTHCFSTCCPPEPPGFSVRDQSSLRLAHNVQEALRFRANPIAAEIQIADAPDEYGILNHKGWSRELANQAILAARQQGAPHSEGSPMLRQARY